MKLLILSTTLAFLVAFCGCKKEDLMPMSVEGLYLVSGTYHSWSPGHDTTYTFSNDTMKITGSGTTIYLGYNGGFRMDYNSDSSTSEVACYTYDLIPTWHRVKFFQNDPDYIWIRIYAENSISGAETIESGRRIR